MITKVIEATNGFNWGKFMLARFDEHEWAMQSHAEVGHPLLRTLGWSHDILWVLDLQTGEGALYQPGGLASMDLEKHRIWVCPLYEPFLEWVYEQDLADISTLPNLVELPKAESAIWGHRRRGPSGE